jgi:hypothetical protein
VILLLNEPTLPRSNQLYSKDLQLMPLGIHRKKVLLKRIIFFYKISELLKYLQRFTLNETLARKEKDHIVLVTAQYFTRLDIHSNRKASR